MLSNKEKESVWRFAPRNGICWYCHRDITKDPKIIEIIERGDYITGCPYCHKSYVD